MHFTASALACPKKCLKGEGSYLSTAMEQPQDRYVETAFEVQQSHRASATSSRAERKKVKF
eukprot:5817923-Alexandrium_andersonii.AAC.1